MPINVEKTKLLLVEGKDEVSVFEELLATIGISDIQVIDCGGNIQLKEKFPIVLKHPNFVDVESYAIIQDAESDFSATVTRVQALLRAHGQPVPRLAGEFAEKNSRRAGVYVMPNNSSNGMLEDLYLATLAGTPILQCIDACVDLLQVNCPPTNDKGVFGLPANPEKRAKVRALGTLMATSVPHNRVGIAAKDGYWNFSHPSMTPFTNFIRQL